VTAPTQYTSASPEIRKHVPAVLDAIRTIGRPATIREISRVSKLPPSTIGKVIDYATASLETENLSSHKYRRLIIHPRPHLWMHWPGYNPQAS
jgi:hypothetical protein